MKELLRGIEDVLFLFAAASLTCTAYYLIEALVAASVSDWYQAKDLFYTSIIYMFAAPATYLAAHLIKLQNKR